MASYCRTFGDDVIEFRQSMESAKGLTALLALMAAPSDVARVFEDLASVAPDEIKRDTESLARAFRRQADSLPDNAADPVKALVSGLVTSAEAGRPFERVDSWISAHCELDLRRISEAATGSSTSTTASGPSGTVVFDEAIECTRGSTSADAGSAAEVIAEFSGVQGVVTIHTSATDKAGHVVSEARINGRDIDGSGGSGALRFTVPTGGWRLEWDTGGNMLSACFAHLRITVVGGAQATSRVADGKLAATRDLSDSAGCRVDGAYVIADDRGDYAGARLRVFDADGDLVVESPEGSANVDGLEARVIAGIDGEGLPVVARVTSSTLPAFGIEPPKTTQVLELLRAGSAAPKWSVDATFGGSPTDRQRSGGGLQLLGVAGSVLIGTIDGPLGRETVAVRLSDGGVAWRRPVDVIVVDHRILTVGPSATVIDPASGSPGVTIAADARDLRSTGSGWISKTQLFTREGAPLADLGGAPASVTVATDLKVVMVEAASMGGVTGYDAATGAVLWQITSSDVEAVGLRFGGLRGQLPISRADQTVGFTDHQLVVLDVETGRQVKVIDPAPAVPPTVGVHVEGHYLVCADAARFFRSSAPPLAAQGELLLAQVR